MSRVLYLYCLARPRLLPLPDDTGLDGGPLFLHTWREVAAVVSWIDPEEFLGPAAEAKSRDLSWIAPRALKHEAVIEGVMGHSPVLPLPYGTLFSSTEKLEERLKGHDSAISGFLDHVAGKEEWAVRGMLDRERARAGFQAAALTEAPPELPHLAPGRRYLIERGLRAAGEGQVNDWLQGICRRLAADLHPCARAFAARKAVHRPPGEGREVLFNWAFLVPREDREEFQARVIRAHSEHSPRGAAFLSSGPWPPYSFSPLLDQDRT